MSLSAIYLWEPEFTNTIPTLNESERTAYELYQKHRNTTSRGNKILQWAEYMVTKVTDSAYNDYFSENTQQWVVNLQQELQADPRAVLELDLFDQIAQGDALYRVFYEAVQKSEVGFYEPRFAVWGFSVLQVPSGAVKQVLQTILQPLSSEQQFFDLDSIEAPRNIKKADELFNLWCSKHPILKNIVLHTFYDRFDFIEPNKCSPDARTAESNSFRFFILICESQNIFYQLKYVLWDLNKFPDIDFTLDLTNFFLTAALAEQYRKKLKVRINIPDIRNVTRISKGTYELNFDFISCRWETTYGVQQFFKEFDRLVKFLDQHFSNGQLQSLQSWAYGDAIDNILVQMHWSQELMIIALGLDKNYLDIRYKFHQERLSTEKKDSELVYLNDSYKEFLLLMDLVRDAGTALAHPLTHNGSVALKRV